MIPGGSSWAGRCWVEVAAVDVVGPAAILGELVRRRLLQIYRWYGDFCSRVIGGC